MFYFSFPPQDIDPDKYLNQGNRCLLLTMEPGISATFAVDQLSLTLAKENHKIIIVVQSGDRDQIYDFFKNSSIKERVCLKFYHGHNIIQMMSVYAEN